MLGVSRDRDTDNMPPAHVASSCELFLSTLVYHQSETLQNHRTTLWETICGTIYYFH